MLEKKNLGAKREIRDLSLDWAKHIVSQRLRQEYETIRGFLILVELSKGIGMERLIESFARVQERFGEETVDAAINVSLKVGKKREKWEGIMLSDHFLERGIDMQKFEGFIRFLNCPVFGSHSYIVNALNIKSGVSSLFFRYFLQPMPKPCWKTFSPLHSSCHSPRKWLQMGIASSSSRSGMHLVGESQRNLFL